MKVGGSPVYYVDGQEEKLQDKFYDYFDQEEKETFRYVTVLRRNSLKICVSRKSQSRQMTTHIAAGSQMISGKRIALRKLPSLTNKKILYVQYSKVV